MKWSFKRFTKEGNLGWYMFIFMIVMGGVKIMEMLIAM